MGFGSYDESEHQNQERHEDDAGEAVNVHENEHDGDLTLETDASPDELLDQLDEMESEDE